MKNLHKEAIKELIKKEPHLPMAEVARKLGIALGTVYYNLTLIEAEEPQK